MIYFILPNLYENFNVNNTFVIYCKEHKEQLKEPLNIVACAGNVPYASWNGGINSCYGNGFLRQDLNTLITNNITAIKFNCSNTLLEDFDKYDNFCNLIFELGDTGSNFIEITNLELMDELNQMHPDNHFKWVLSKNASNLLELTPDFLNQLIEFDKFDMIDLPYRNSRDIDFLKQINHRRKIAISVNSMCPSNCNNFNMCLAKENSYQLNYSIESTFKSCSRLQHFWMSNISNNILSLEEIKQNYIPLNFIYYTLDLPLFLPPIQVLNIYVKYFIKQEYQTDVLIELSQAIMANNGGKTQ